MNRWTHGRETAGRRGDEGAILVLSLILITVIALVAGVLLTRGDGSLRATVKLRQVAGTTYAADGAAQAAINAIRTGYNDAGGSEPSNWVFTNDVIPGAADPNLREGCFGWNASKQPDPDMLLSGFYPAAKSSGDADPTSAYVDCVVEDNTGAAGPPVLINGSNKPGYAIVTLNGPVDATGSKSPGLLVKGGIYANGSVLGNVRVTEGGVRATGSCDATVTATPKNCNTATPVPDPNYGHELGSTVPQVKTPPTSCTGTVAIFEPGYYDNAASLSTATNLCDIAWFKPGSYYFDFHNDGCSTLCPSNLFGSSVSDNTWRINGATVIGGDPVAPDNNNAGAPRTTVSVPGSCVSPITDPGAQGVQFVFGGSSRVYIDQNSKVELCASYFPDRPPIEVYGLKTGSASSTDRTGLSATGSISSSGQGTWSGLSTANIASANGTSATWDPGSASSRSTTITASGFTPATAPPAGSILTSATLRVRHRNADATTSSAASATLKVGTITSSSLSLADGSGKGFASMTDSSVTFNASTNSGVFNALQTAIYKGTYNGATVTYSAKSSANKTSSVDAITLDLTYTAPALRGQSGTCIDGTGSSCYFLDMKNGNNKAVVYLQGTTYVPRGHLRLLLGNFASEIMKFGLVSRRLDFAFFNGNSGQDYPVIEIPDNSPGFGVKSTIVQLKVYVCRNSTTCAKSGTPALTTRVQFWDPSGTPQKDDREVRILSWSHSR